MECICLPELITEVKRKPLREEDLFRPEVPDYLLNSDQVDDTLISLMCSCWAEEPQDRPSFYMIRRVVRSLNKFVVTVILIFLNLVLPTVMVIGS